MNSSRTGERCTERDADLPVHRHRGIDPPVGGVAGDARSRRAALRRAARGGGGTAGARCSPRWATASRPRSRRPTPPCRRRSRPSGACRRSASRCGWASTPVRWSASATTSAVAPSTAPPASWRSATAARSCVSDVSAALVRSGPSPVGFADLGTHRLRDLTEPERVWQVVHPDLPQHFPPVRGLDTYANNLPAQRSSLVGRDRDVARVDRTRRGSTASSPSPASVGSARPGWPCRPPPTCCREFADVWFVELASVADPDDVADAIALTMGLGAATDPLAAAAAMLAGERHAARGRQLRARRRQRRGGDRRADRRVSRASR